MFKKIKKFLFKYERYFSPLALFGGFIIDNLTLRRIDLWAENVLIILYLGLALFSIFVLNIFHAGFLKHPYFRKTDSIFTLILQFVYGGLFSVFFVFYFRSSSILVSWIFLLVLFGFLVANEKFREYYKKLYFQLAIFFILLFSYSVFLLPLVLRKLGDLIFISSGIFSLLVFALILFCIYKFFPKRFFLNRKWIYLNTVVIFILFNTLYFLNIIPPIPLSLEKSELVHGLKKVDNSYLVSYEKSSLFEFTKSSKTFSWVQGEPVYLFTSVFAPARINIDIYHNWYFYNKNNGIWEHKSTLSYSVLGGRNGGFRGYSYKQALEPGKWKIEVSNKNGQILGIKKFEIKKVDTTPPLEEEVW